MGRVGVHGKAASSRAPWRVTLIGGAKPQTRLELEKKKIQEERLSHPSEKKHKSFASERKRSARNIFQPGSNEKSTDKVMLVSLQAQTHE